MILYARVIVLEWNAYKRRVHLKLGYDRAEISCTRLETIRNSKESVIVSALAVSAPPKLAEFRHPNSTDHKIECSVATKAQSEWLGWFLIKVTSE